MKKKFFVLNETDNGRAGIIYSRRSVHLYFNVVNFYVFKCCVYLRDHFMFFIMSIMKIMNNLFSLWKELYFFSLKALFIC